MNLKYVTFLFVLLCCGTATWAMEEFDDESGSFSRLSASSDDEWNSEEEAEEDTAVKPITYVPHLISPLQLLGSGYAEAQFELKSEEGSTTSIPCTPHNLKATVIGFEPEEELPDLSSLTPDLPFVADFDYGKYHKRVRYSFEYGNVEYKGEAVDTLSPAYIPTHEWELCKCDVEDYAENYSRLKLHLKIQLEDDSSQTAFTFEKKKFLHHEPPHPSQMGPQLPGKLYFNGQTVTLRQCRQAKMTIPACLDQPSEQYDGLFNENEQVIPTHGDSEIVFVETIPIPGEALPQSTVGYRGDYDYPSVSLAPANKKGDLTAKFLIYSDGSDIFFPKVTHELWQRNGWRVGFGIASYKESQKLEFIPQIKKKLPKGLYRLDSIKEKKNQRIETWVRLGEDPIRVRLTPPAGVSSVIGMGCAYVPTLITK